MNLKLPTRRAQSCVLFVLLIAAVPRADAQPADAYRTLVDDYRRYGASAVTAATNLGEPAVTAAVDAALSDKATPPWTWEELRAAAILHTEAALQFVQRAELSPANVHLTAAARLLDGVTVRAPAQQDYAYRWHDLMGSWLRQLGARGMADVVRRRQRDRFGEAPARARFTSGVNYEILGSIDSTAASSQDIGFLGQHGELPSRWWITAAREFESALTADEQFLPAALHLGRIRMLQERPADAAPLLRRAASSSDPRVRYLASLFLGAIAERQDRLDEAETLYRDGVALYPWGQSAHLALAELLSRTGRDTDARTLLIDKFGRAPRIIEPLWTYLLKPGQEPATLWDEIRCEVWK